MILTNETIALRSANIDKAIAMYGASEEMDGMGYTLQDMRDLLDTLADREERIRTLQMHHDTALAELRTTRAQQTEMQARIERVKDTAERIKQLNKAEAFQWTCDEILAALEDK
jgi:hypothetical protein